MEWHDIRQEYETTPITLKALAEKHGIKLGTLKSRKSREKWQKGKEGGKSDPGAGATRLRKDATRKKKDATLKPDTADELDPKHELFCLYYIKYFNATKAYQAAYECKYTTAGVNGHKLLKNTRIAARIDELKAEQLQEVRYSARDVLQKYIDIANADILDYVEYGEETKGRKEIIGYDDDDQPIEISVGEEQRFFRLKDSAKVDGTIVTEIKDNQNGVSVKLADRMKALEVLKEYTDLLNVREMDLLRAAKIRAETEKLKVETKNEDAGGAVYIVQNKDKMREAMEARAAAAAEREAVE